MAFILIGCCTTPATKIVAGTRRVWSPDPSCSSLLLWRKPHPDAGSPTTARRWKPWHGDTIHPSKGLDSCFDYRIPDTTTLRDFSIYPFTSTKVIRRLPCLHCTLSWSTKQQTSEMVDRWLCLLACLVDHADSLAPVQQIQDYCSWCLTLHDRLVYLFNPIGKYASRVTREYRANNVHVY